MIVVAAAIWGTLGPATRALYEVAEIDALAISFIRQVVAAPILAALWWRTRTRRVTHLKRADLSLALLGGVGMVLSQVSYAASVAWTTVSIATLITLCLAPIVVALVSAVLLQERLSGLVLLALGLALAGTMLLVGFPESATGLSGTGDGSLFGMALAMGSAFTYATGTLAQRSVAGRLHPFQVVALGSLAGLAVLGPPIVVRGIPLAYPPEAWALLIYLALFPTVVAYLLFVAGMRYTTATIATIVTLLEPVVATALAWMLFGERLGLPGLVGGLLLLGAVWLLYYRRAGV